MNNNPEIMTDEQYDFCKKQANSLAKILMDKDVSDIFGNNGNANFVLETIVILTSGSLSVISDKINIDVLSVMKCFFSQIEKTIKYNENKPFLSLVN